MKNHREEWVRWNPIPKLASKYFLTNVKDDYHGLSGMLIDQKYEKNGLFFRFEGLVRAYRLTTNYCSKKIMEEAVLKYDSEFFADWTFFLVKNTKYDDWIFEQSCELSALENVKHMALVGSNYLLEVITSSNIILTELPLNEEWKNTNETS